MKKVMVEFVLEALAMTQLVAVGMMAIAFSVLSLYRITLGEDVVMYLFWFVLTSFATVLDALVMRQEWKDLTEKYDELDEDVTEEFEA